MTKDRKNTALRAAIVELTYWLQWSIANDFITKAGKKDLEKVIRDSERALVSFAKYRIEPCDLIDDKFMFDNDDVETYASEELALLRANTLADNFDKVNVIRYEIIAEIKKG